MLKKTTSWPTARMRSASGRRDVLEPNEDHAFIEIVHQRKAGANRCIGGSQHRTTRTPWSSCSTTSVRKRKDVAAEMESLAFESMASKPVAASPRGLAIESGMTSS